MYNSGVYFGGTNSTHVMKRQVGKMHVVVSFGQI
jgi:hypothetical protein